jgi:hypothetical protein
VTASVCAVIETRAFRFGTVRDSTVGKEVETTKANYLLGVCGCKTVAQADRGQIDENAGM